jgi:CO/xanthine dehydrogenase FAD-binding subunit
VLIHIGRIAELGRLHVDPEGRLHLGAMVSHAMIEASSEVIRGWPALADASSIVGSPATRNVGTVGGNLCNASPAMEIGAALLVYGAQVTLTGRSGTRTLEIAEFMTGPGQTARNRDEILTEVVVPRAQSWQGSAYVRLGFRLAMEIAVVGAAAAISLDAPGTVADCRIALTAVAPTVIRATGAEAALRGNAPSSERIGLAGEAARLHAKPIDDVRAPAWYRLDTTATVTRRALELALDRARTAKGR